MLGYVAFLQKYAYTMSRHWIKPREARNNKGPNINIPKFFYLLSHTHMAGAYIYIMRRLTRVKEGRTRMKLHHNYI